MEFSIGFIGSNSVNQAIIRRFKEYWPKYTGSLLISNRILGNSLMVSRVENYEWLLRNINEVKVDLWIISWRSDLESSMNQSLFESIINRVSDYDSKVIFFSSVAVYGRLQDEVYENTPLAPCTKYGFHKLNMERKLGSAFNNGNLTTLRISNIVGSAVQSGPIRAVKDALFDPKDTQKLVRLSKVRNFISDDDLALVVFRTNMLMQHGSESYTLNVGSTKSTWLPEVVHSVARATQIPDFSARFIYDHEIPYSFVNIDNLKKAIGVSPEPPTINQLTALITEAEAQ